MRRADRYISDKDITDLLWKYIRLCPRGLPLGLRTSHPLANLELCWMDHVIKEKYHCKWYGRYMDDFYVIHPDKEFLKQLRHDLEAELAVIGLELNDKTQIFPIRHGIDFFLVSAPMRLIAERSSVSSEGRIRKISRAR